MDYVGKLLFVVSFFTLSRTETIVDSTPIFFVSPDDNITVSQTLQVSNYSVTVGSNVTLCCQFPQEPAWLTTIGKFSIDGEVIIPLYENGNATADFTNAIEKHPAIAERMESSVHYLSPNSTTRVCLKLLHVQPYDLGTYGCFSRNDDEQRTAFVNITLVSNFADVYDVMAVEMDQQIEVSRDSDIFSFSFAVYRSPHSSTDYLLWFDECQWSKLGEYSETIRSLTCQNKPSTYSAFTAMQTAYGVGVINSQMDSEFIDMNVYPLEGMFYDYVIWQMVVVRDLHSLSLSTDDVTNSWLNRTLACFAFRNGSGTLRNDFLTFVQPGVDLRLDPNAFSCSSHHVLARQGNIVTFSCSVTLAIYRVKSWHSWEIWSADDSGEQRLFFSFQSQSDLDVYGYGELLQLTESQSSAGGASRYLILVRSSLQVLVNESSTAVWRFRLTVTCQDGQSQRSSYFTIGLLDEIAPASSMTASACTIRSTLPVLLSYLTFIAALSKFVRV